MLVLCLVLALWPAEARRPPAARRDVPTTQGYVGGYRQESPPHFAYYGVPYAAPFTRSRRFESPQPPPRWDGLFEATRRVRCPQRVLGGDENCLVLNIFAPEGAISFPVLVHFHDGGFNTGWGSFEPPRRLLYNDIVVVTFNYRLGALGFLSLPADGVGGNLGLRDQVAALYWLQRNIAGFGGDPAAVTVYGAGAGAASIELLALSGLSESLFQQAILESGSALSPYTITHDPESAAREAAIGFEFPNEEKYKDLAMLYRRTPVAKLANITFNFLPCIERQSTSREKLVFADPIDILKMGNFQKVPIIYAFTNQEGIKYKDNYEEWNGTAEEFFKMFMPENFEFGLTSTRRKVENMVQKLYVDDKQNVDWQEVYSNFFSYVGTVYPMVKSAFLYSFHSSAPVYMLEFSYTSKINPKDIKSYIYSKEFEHGGDELAAERLSTLWSNFIKYGDPTPLTSSLLPLIWPPVQRSSPHITRLTPPQRLSFGSKLTIMSQATNSHLAFWDTINEKFYRFDSSQK